MDRELALRSLAPVLPLGAADMPLTPEQQERIAEEERQRVEEEIFRARIRDHYVQELTRKHYESRRNKRRRFRMPRVPGITTRSPLTWVYIASMVLLAFVVARQFGWLRRAPAHADPIQVARNQEALPAPQEAPAVFGERHNEPTATVTMTPAPALAPPPVAIRDTSTRNRTTSTSVPSDINDFLRRWTDSVIAGNAEGQAKLYGPTAEVYFTKHNVPHAQIEADKRRMLQLYPNVKYYTVSDVHLDSVHGDRAQISLTKRWDMAGAHRFAGAEREILTLARTDGDWKIVGEKETQVFWRKRD
jgi:hypothetical protein